MSPSSGSVNRMRGNLVLSHSNSQRDFGRLRHSCLIPPSISGPSLTACRGLRADVLIYAMLYLIKVSVHEKMVSTALPLGHRRPDAAGQPRYDR